MTFVFDSNCSSFIPHHSNYNLFIFLEAGLGENPSADGNPSLTKKMKKSLPPPSQAPEPLAISLPHLVYRIEFLESDVNESGFWNGTDDQILDNIFKKNSVDENNKNPEESKVEAKVIVVVELPIGGAVIKFNVGDTDDTLEIQIRKHALMLNPRALLFSGIKSGTLNLATDGPNTARGGIRLNESSKALEAYRKQEQKLKKKSKGGNDASIMTLTFDLPDFVDRDSVKHYSYCFEQRQNSQLQYAITYFEFDVKDAKAQQEEKEKFTAASSMLFSNAPPPGNSNNNNSTNPATGGSSNTQNTAFLGNNGGVSFSGTTGNNLSNDNNEDFKMDDPDEDDDWNKDWNKDFEEDEEDNKQEDEANKAIYTENDVSAMRRRLDAVMNDKIDWHRKEYAAKLRANIDEIKAHKADANLRDDKLRKQISERDAYIDEQRSKISEQEKEMADLIEYYKCCQEKMKEELEAANALAHQAQEETRIIREQVKAVEESAAAAIANRITAPRMIQVHTSYDSLIDHATSTTPLKRAQRVDEANDDTAAVSSESISTSTNSLSANFSRGENESENNIAEKVAILA